MIYKAHEVLAETANFTGLQDGDILRTGTPSGVGLVNCGKIFEVKLYGQTAAVVSPVVG